MRAKRVRIPPLVLLMSVTFAAVLPALLFAGLAQDCAAPATLGRSPAYPDPYPAAADPIAIPAQSDWIDYGPVLVSGAAGAWDDGLGMAPPMSTIVRKDGSFFFYYVGFDGVRASDEGERHRSVGVATSSDGIRFTKHAQNPIITYRPNNNEEEAAGGVAATVDAAGNVALYWGAADAGSPTSTQVDSDIRVSLSSDGLNFVDQGDIVSHLNPTVWGYGDELFPLGAFSHEGIWQLYYIAKSPFGIDWDVGLATGTAPNNLTQTRCALTSPGASFFGGGSVLALSPETYAIFLARNNQQPFFEFRTFSPQTPHLLSDPVVVYNFPNTWGATVFLDRERRTWLMYALDSSTSADYFEWTIHLKMAPAGPTDTSPPSAPPSPQAAVASQGVELSWGAAQDPDTGVVNYAIYRDGQKIASTFDLQYHDTSAAATPTAVYTIAAVNLHGVEGPRSEPVKAGGTPPRSGCFFPLIVK
jgi:hypothetical protein